MREGSSSTWSMTARWVFPVEGPPLPNATVIVQGDRIHQIEPQGGMAADLDLGNVALLPGFTNAHTHLDLTGLHGKCPPGADFTAWLRGVIAHRRNQTPEQIQEDIRAGLGQSLRLGVTLLGDISAGGLSRAVLAEAPVRSVIFFELLGLTEPRAEQAWKDAQDWLRAHPATDNFRPGLSPHAPYSVRSSLFEQVLTCPPEVPVAVHLAETGAELRLLRERDGPFVDFLRELGVWDPKGLVPGIEELVVTFSRRKTLWIHGTFLDPDLPALRNGTVVYCPRTHAAFGHPPHPFRGLHRQTVRLALGTDSLASNPDLSILEEVRFLYRSFPDLDGAWLLNLATLAGAEALGWDEVTGSLLPGKSADLVALPLPDRDDADPHRLVLDSTLLPARVLWRGQWV